MNRASQVVSIPCGLAPLLLFFLPESPRWLLTKGRIEEAKKVLIAGARRNNLRVDEKSVVLRKPATGTTKKGTVMDIMRYPTLRKKTLIMYFNWFTSSFILYGLALNWQNLTGGLFMNFLVASILDFPAKFLALVLPLRLVKPAANLYIFSLKKSLIGNAKQSQCTSTQCLIAPRYGCRLPYICLTGFAGLMFTIALCIPRGIFPNELPIVVFTLIGSFSGVETFHKTCLTLRSKFML